jgi:FAD synthetase
MVRVMAQGVFDLLHLGHVHYLCKAKELGDELVVVIASDSTVRRRKHEPITPQEMRRDMVASLRCVDQAVVGSEGGDPYAVVEELRPDIIALGHDQAHDEEEINAELARRGLPTRVVRLDYYNHDLARRAPGRQRRGRSSSCLGASVSRTRRSRAWTWPPTP